MPEPDSDLSLELVRRIQSGDRGAWDALYRRYHDPLLFAIRSRLGPGLRAWVQSEDILHSVVEDALRDLGRFEPRGAGSLRHYFHVCVLNKIRSRAARLHEGPRGREERVRSSEFEHMPDRTSDLCYLDGERYEELERGLAGLPDSMREVVLLRTVEGLGNEEAAALLERTPAAVSKLYNRALARLGLRMKGM